MRFNDRLDAARRLAVALHPWRGKKPAIFAIPRGAVPMGRVIAEALGGELDVILTRKLAAPGNPELAIGAVGESGWVLVDEGAEFVSEDYIREEIARERGIIARRRADYTPIRPPLDPCGRIAIAVDDGLATGSTMVAALHDLREKKPAELICAVPVASGAAVRRVAEVADRVVCLHVQEDFWGVGQFYLDFTQVSDAQVLEALRAAVAQHAEGPNRPIEVNAAR